MSRERATINARGRKGTGRKALVALCCSHFMTNSSTLFLLAHPFYKDSRSAHEIVHALRDVPNLTVHNLYDQYPYFHIDTDHEKQLLLSADTIVVHHPFYWYAMPALMRQWLDDVLAPGWAYGPIGRKLEGKKFLLSMTIGGPSESYATTGYNRYPMETFLAPWEQIAHICHMQWSEPHLLYNSTRVSDDELKKHAQRLRDRIVR